MGTGPYIIVVQDQFSHEMGWPSYMYLAVLTDLTPSQNDTMMKLCCPHRFDSLNKRARGSSDPEDPTGRFAGPADSPQACSRHAPGRQPNTNSRPASGDLRITLPADLLQLCV